VLTGTVLARLDHWSRDAIPAAVTLAVILVGTVPWPFTGTGTVSPMLPVIALFFWVVHRPGLMSPWVAFALGLVHDALAGTPLGMNALVFVVVHAVVAQQRHHLLERPFVLGWAAFAAVALLASLLKWMLASLYHLTPVGFDPVIAQLLGTILLYPVLAWLLGRLDLLLLGDEPGA
jgi:rod shape-determining protein MreD